MKKYLIAIVMLVLSNCNSNDSEHIFRSVAAGNLVEVQEYIGAGSNLNITDSFGWSLIMVAVIEEKLDILNLLLDHDVDLSQKSKMLQLNVFELTEYLISQIEGGSENMVESLSVEVNDTSSNRIYNKDTMLEMKSAISEKMH